MNSTILKRFYLKSNNLAITSHNLGLKGLTDFDLPL